MVSDQAEYGVTGRYQCASRVSEGRSRWRSIPIEAQEGSYSAVQSSAGEFHALITREEFIARNPGRKLPETATATENRSTTQRIRWHLSHLYREHRNTIVERSRAKREGKQLPGLKPLCYTQTMKALVLHFFDRVVHHGPEVVPYIEEEDGQKSDDDFFQRVLKRDVAGDNDGVGVLGTDEHIKTESTEDADPDWSPLNN